MKRTRNGKSKKAKADRIDEVDVEDITEAITGEFEILRLPELAANLERQHPLAEVATPEAGPGAAHGVAAPAAETNGTAAAQINGAAAAQVNGAAVAHADPDPSQRGDSERAAFLLSHLETEIARLHEKWHGIDAEFKIRDARIVQLHEDLESRDAAMEKLGADLHGATAALAAAEERAAGKDKELAALAADQQARDARIERLLADGEAAEQRQRALNEKVVATDAEAARLARQLQQEQARVAEVAAANDGLRAEKQQLQEKVQDLETYIDGRRGSWLELQAEIDGRKNALVAMEKIVRTRDESMARHDEEQKRLAARILDLERECSELAGRRKEREAAHDEVQAKLAHQLVLTEQLKAEYASRLKEMEQASAKAVSNQKLVESLERGMERRDESLAELTASLEKHQRAAGELAILKEKLTHRADDLERSLQERVLQVQTLRDESHAAHEELRIAQQQLAERSTHLAASQQLAEEKARLVDSLAADVRALQSDIAAARADSARSAERAAEAARLHDEALEETKRLKAEAVVQRESIARLEADLGKKQAAADLLERNVGRITDLKASMAALDLRLDEKAGARDSALIDFGSTVASDKPLGAVGPADDDLPGDALVRTRSTFDRANRDVPEARARARRFIMLDGPDPIDYPFVKNDITIGRGRDNDIRIASQFISRVHARVSTQGARTVIEDAGSKNGILVNSERVDRHVLRDGDVVSLGGELNLKFVDAATAPQ
jgi:chromosome segregation ATPase